MHGGGFAAGPRGAWVQVFCLALLLQFGCDVVSYVMGVFKGFEFTFGYSFVDLRLRYNEVECSHTGVNPYRVWEGEVESLVYKPWYRPDRPGNGTFDGASSEDDGMRPVVSYPPWHTALFWWYPHFPKWAVIAAAWLLYCLLAVGFVLYLWRWRPGGLLGNAMFLACIGFGCAFPFLHCMTALNYGNLLILLFIIIYEAHKWGEGARRGSPASADGAGRRCSHPRAVWVASQVVQALALVFVMLKPQIGLLLVLPLLAGKRFLAVGLAAVLCVLLTLWPAHVYGESPLELILQIAKFGAPYTVLQDEWRGFAKYVWKYLGFAATVGWSVGVLALCAALSLLFRRQASVLVRFLPAILLFPLFGYSNIVDFGLFWPALFFLVLTLLGRGPVLLSGRDCLGLSLLFVLAQLPVVVDNPLKIFMNTGSLAEATKNHIMAGFDTFALLMHALMAALLALRLWQARGQEPNPKWVERPW